MTYSSSAYLCVNVAQHLFKETLSILSGRSNSWFSVLYFLGFVISLGYELYLFVKRIPCGITKQYAVSYYIFNTTTTRPNRLPSGSLSVVFWSAFVIGSVSYTLKGPQNLWNAKDTYAFDHATCYNEVEADFEYLFSMWPYLNWYYGGGGPSSSSSRGYVACSGLWDYSLAEAL